jgi:hypothetical protein
MNNRDSIEISIVCYGTDADDLRYILEGYLMGLEDTPTLRIETQGSRFRTLDPSILVAVVGVAGTALGALIAGLLKVSQERASQRIVIQGKDGTKLELPANTPPEKIDELIEKIRKMNAPYIYM